MTPYELLDLALSLSNRIDTHWTLFITVHLALIGGIIYVDRPLERNEKIITMIIYLGFALINYLMMKNQALFLGSIYQQIDEIKGEACCVGNHVIQYIVSLYQYKTPDKMIISILVAHVVMVVIVAISIVYDQAVPKNDSPEK